MKPGLDILKTLQNEASTDSIYGNMIVMKSEQDRKRLHGLVANLRQSCSTWSILKCRNGAMMMFGTIPFGEEDGHVLRLGGRIEYKSANWVAKTLKNNTSEGALILEYRV